MGTWLRRIRGAIGMGLTWAVGWGLVGGIPRWVFGINTDAPIPILLGAAAFFAGFIFTTMLSLTQSGREFEQLSIRRFAAWGALGGALLAGVFAAIASIGLVDLLILAPTFAIASAACATGSLAIARQGAKQLRPNGAKAVRDALQ